MLILDWNFEPYPLQRYCPKQFAEMKIQDFLSFVCRNTSRFSALLLGGETHFCLLKYPILFLSVKPIFPKLLCHVVFYLFRVFFGTKTILISLMIKCMQTKSINVQWWMNKTNRNGWIVDEGGRARLNECIVYIDRIEHE